MNNSAIPVQSSKTLVKATLTAALLAAVLLVTVILPAEYNLDPTGLGKSLGLTKLAVSEAGAAEAPAAPEAEDVSQDFRSDRVFVTVPAGKGVEYKFHVEQGDKLTFTWSTKGESLYFDFHAEPSVLKPGQAPDFFESFSISTAKKVEGTHTAPFTGQHGWWWKNETDGDIEVKLDTRGVYKIVGLK